MPPVRSAGLATAAKVIITAMTAIVLPICALIMFHLVWQQTGTAGVVIGTVLAVIPVLPAMALFLWLDRHESEPIGLLVAAFGWGSIIATFAAMISNSLGAAILYVNGTDPTWTAVFIAPVVEETWKAAIILLIVVLQRDEFDGVLDGVVYAGVTAIGFAFTENILYFGRAFADTGEVSQIFFMRAIMSPFAHPLFTIAAGVGIGLSIKRKFPTNLIFIIGGWSVAVLMHAWWNFTALLGTRGFLQLYFGLQVPLFIVAAVAIWRVRRREINLIARHARGYGNAGWFSPGEVAMMQSSRSRRVVRRWARHKLTGDSKKAVRDFHALVGDLAYARERIHHGNGSEKLMEKERTLLSQIKLVRQRCGPEFAAKLDGGRQ